MALAYLRNEVHNITLHAHSGVGVLTERGTQDYVTCTQWRRCTYGTRYTTLRYIHAVALAYLREHNITLHAHGDVSVLTERGTQHYVTCTQWSRCTYRTRYTTLRYMHAVTLAYLREHNITLHTHGGVGVLTGSLSCCSTTPLASTLGVTCCSTTLSRPLHCPMMMVRRLLRFLCRLSAHRLPFSPSLASVSTSGSSLCSHACLPASSFVCSHTCLPASPFECSHASSFTR